MGRDLFIAHSILVFVLSCLCYAFVFFHRSAPAIVSSDMAITFGVDKASLGYFSTMFFWPYAVMQPFGGLLADIMDPSILIGAASLVTSLGSMICGFSESPAVAAFGRFVVGIGAAPTYVPICRVLIQWFPAKYYAVLSGIVLGCGGVGGIVAQVPLEKFSDEFGWRWAYWGIAIIGAFVSILVFIFIRGRPSQYGYDDITEPPIKTDATLKERFATLWSNLIAVIKTPQYWWFSLYCFFNNGGNFNLSSMYSGYYIEDVYPTWTKSEVLLAYSIAMIVGSVVLPLISDLIHTRKYVMLFCSVIAAVSAIATTAKVDSLSFGAMFALFFIYSFGAGACTSASFPLVKETFDPKISASAIGLVNFLAFIGGGIFQAISGALLGASDKTMITETKEGYSAKSYRNSIWIPTIVYSVLSGIFPLLLKDMFKKQEENTDQNEEALSLNEEENDVEKNLDEQDAASNACIENDQKEDNYKNESIEKDYQGDEDKGNVPDA